MPSRLWFPFSPPAAASPVSGGTSCDDAFSILSRGCREVTARGLLCVSEFLRREFAKQPASQIAWMPDESAAMAAVGGFIEFFSAPLPFVTTKPVRRFVLGSVRAA
eukprot:TRINITY_DN7856_c0_g1_i1.p2 TRINITY_DN7856_c0_g1~~TRINITY_DN7856_c0_g1_i1.p2  ORF type:complete len:106 (+),score=8.88 TRINITY_DN7856_c0_g1_i1:206-523(+)